VENETAVCVACRALVRLAASGGGGGGGGAPTAAAAALRGALDAGPLISLADSE
jgi:hypothetical protein